MPFLSPQTDLYKEALLRLFYPAECSLCHMLLEISQRHLCPSCTDSLAALELPFQNRLLEESHPFLTQIWSLFPYEAQVKELITAIKFHHKRALIQTLKPSFQEFGRFVTSGNLYDAITPIPMDPWKILERQFHFTEILGRLIAEVSQIPIKNLLRKSFGITPQSRLKREERLTNLHAAFHLRRQDEIKGLRILLIDDIITTGSTASEAARMLKKAGAKSVDLLTLAKTL